VIGGLIGEKIETRRKSMQRASGNFKVQITDFLRRKSDEKQIFGADDGSANPILSGSLRRPSIIQKNIMTSSPRKSIHQNNQGFAKGSIGRGSWFGLEGAMSH
jgi:hypothetical protein